MGCIDYRKAYDMVPHSWIVEMLELVNVADNVKGLLCDCWYFSILCSYYFVVLSCIVCNFFIYAQIRRRGH